MFAPHILEEELKNKVAAAFFDGFDTTPIIGKIDFCVAVSGEQGTLFNNNLEGYVESLLWAEAKRGRKSPRQMKESLVQLILTIGRARTFDNHLPPSFLGAFDAEKIAFLPYSKVMPVFSQNDFNWNVPPSNHDTKEFRQLFSLVEDLLDNNALTFRFGSDEKELRQFIRANFRLGNADINRVSVNKNNFVTVYNKWVQAVQPTISIDWQGVRQYGILSGDFFLADLLSQENSTLIDKLFVLLRSNHYELDRKVDALGFEESKRVSFSDGQKAHRRFWQRYNRPPKEEYWDYIVERRDLLVPQDVRERKGSFFTPQRWVELSQQYIADTLGENWQDEYYIWDCCAGTGNLLAGLTNKYNIWASTLDKADVEVMRERIANGANLLESHIFQFDFLNGDFSTLPQGLQDIISNPEKRKKLVIYINPPYAEATTARTVTGTGTNKAGTAIGNRTHEKYKGMISKASNELFAQFFIRIQQEIKGCVLAEFSKLKILQAANFSEFRKIFRAKLEKIFLVPADTFDNVRGAFPIGFFVWDTSKDEVFTEIFADVYERNGERLPQKRLSTVDERKGSINAWIKKYDSKCAKAIGYLPNPAPDYQNNNYLFISNELGTRHVRYIPFTENSLIPACVYFAVRHCIEATWLNDRDQFLYPNDGWQTDREFQSDCLVFTLFHGQNRISTQLSTLNSQLSTNHWIPFTEEEVGAKECFASHFMSAKFRVQSGEWECKVESAECRVQKDLFSDTSPNCPLSTIHCPLSIQANAVMDAGRELWRYYHREAGNLASYNPNASLYDIKAHFQGRNAQGKMNATSPDETYNTLIASLRTALKALAKKIEPKVYEHGFLR